MLAVHTKISNAGIVSGHSHDFAGGKVNQHLHACGLDPRLAKTE